MPRNPVCFNLTIVFSISSSPLSQKPPAPWQRVWTHEPGRRVLARDLELDFHPANDRDEGQNLRPHPKARLLLRFLTECLGMGCPGACHNEVSGRGMSLMLSHGEGA